MIQRVKLPMSLKVICQMKQKKRARCFFFRSDNMKNNQEKAFANLFYKNLKLLCSCYDKWNKISEGPRLRDNPDDNKEAEKK